MLFQLLENNFISLFIYSSKFNQLSIPFKMYHDTELFNTQLELESA